MKKIILLGLFLAMTLQSSFAQINEDEMTQQMQRMEQQLKQMMQQLQSTMGEGQFFTDTLFIQKFDDLQLEEGQLPFGGSDFDMSGMFKLFEDQFKQLEASDFEELQKIFDQLQIQPEKLDQMEKKSPDDSAQPKDKAKPSKPKKKRKTYKI